MTRPEFDDLPYSVQVEMVAHWEVEQEITEHYNQRAEEEAKKNS